MSLTNTAGAPNEFSTYIDSIPSGGYSGVYEYEFEDTHDGGFIHVEVAGESKCPTVWPMNRKYTRSFWLSSNSLYNSYTYEDTGTASLEVNMYATGSNNRIIIYYK